MYYLPRFNSDIFIILELIENNDLEGVRNYLKEYGNKDINCSFNIRGYPDNWYTTPINEAIKNNKFEIADILLDNGANINTICSQILDVNELHGYKMVFKFDDKINKENLKYLLEHNYRIERVTSIIKNISKKIKNADKKLNDFEIELLHFFNIIETFLRDILLKNDIDICKKYINDNHILLKELNSDTFDILIYAIEKKVSNDKIKYIIEQSLYTTYDYIIKPKNIINSIDLKIKSYKDTINRIPCNDWFDSYSLSYNYNSSKKEKIIPIKYYHVPFKKLDKISPIYSALHNNNIEIANLLFEKGYKFKKDDDFINNLYDEQCLTNDNLNFILDKNFYKVKDSIIYKWIETPELKSIIDERESLIKYCISSDVNDLNNESLNDETNNENFDILIYAIENYISDDKIIAIINKYYYDKKKSLNYHIKYVNNIYSDNKYIFSYNEKVPLFSAIMNGKYEIADLLIKLGADINFVFKKENKGYNDNNDDVDENEYIDVLK
ncbi:ankyrin [Neocallimastix californiae]|uniref:Ankyrin n=1 Tax=Neocallimastix californiae TaxID=1754190 RepID=A0A1Y2CEF1_9FUNG|nr:ankyrin [Neocallimastix californiae]|eukprot:ORY45423.1 ankyrin [Neocallimastix californiae]